MVHEFVKSLVLKSISLGLKVPESPFDRFIELTHLKTLLKELNVNCILDVGANHGQFAHDLRGIGYRGHIISFEPIHREFASMAKLFASDTKWMGYQMALGSEEKIVKINIPRLTVMSSILKSIKIEPETECQEIEMKRLDTLFPLLIKHIQSPRVFLKMDTQGFDLEVFKGGQGCIDNIVGLQSELSIIPLYENMPHYLDALAAYEAGGFELYNLSVVNRISSDTQYLLGCTRTDHGGLLELNCFMKRPRVSLPNNVLNKLDKGP